MLSTLTGQDMSPFMCWSSVYITAGCSLENSGVFQMTWMSFSISFVENTCLIAYKSKKFHLLQILRIRIYIRPKIRSFSMYLVFSVTLHVVERFPFIPLWTFFGLRHLVKKYMGVHTLVLGYWISLKSLYSELFMYLFWTKFFLTRNFEPTINTYDTKYHGSLAEPRYFCHITSCKDCVI